MLWSARCRAASQIQPAPDVPVSRGRAGGPEAEQSLECGHW